MKKKHQSIQNKVDNEVTRILSTSMHNELVPVIMFVNSKDKQNLINKLDNAGCRIKYEYDFINAISVDAYTNLINELAQDDSVNYIAGDIRTKTCLDVARPEIGVDNTQYTGENVGVAVIDTGIYPHPDLVSKSQRIISFVDFVNKKTKPYDDNGHGTHCAGIIAGDGTMSNRKFTGIAPKANIIGLKVMDKYGAGNASDIVAALEWVLNNSERFNIKVVSMSLGASMPENKLYDPLVIACEKLWSSGITVVAAAGNDGPKLRSIDTPGVSKKIITVGASDDNRTVPYDDDFVAEFSSRGPSPYTKFKPDILAPGVNITSASNLGGYEQMTGTSMAVPMVSGCCALLYEKYPSLSPNEIKQKIMKGTYSLKKPNYVQGKGIINAKMFL